MVLHKPGNRFRSVARVCQRQLDFLVALGCLKHDMEGLKYNVNEVTILIINQFLLQH